jgi:hypothetical protein
MNDLNSIKTELARLDHSVDLAKAELQQAVGAVRRVAADQRQHAMIFASEILAECEPTAVVNEGAASGRSSQTQERIDGLFEQNTTLQKMLAMAIASPGRFGTNGANDQLAIKRDILAFVVAQGYVKAGAGILSRIFQLNQDQSAVRIANDEHRRKTNRSLVFDIAALTQIESMPTDVARGKLLPVKAKLALTNKDTIQQMGSSRGARSLAHKCGERYPAEAMAGIARAERLDVVANSAIPLLSNSESITRSIAALRHDLASINTGSKERIIMLRRRMEQTARTVESHAWEIRNKILLHLDSQVYLNACDFRISDRELDHLRKATSGHANFMDAVYSSAAMSFVSRAGQQSRNAGDVCAWGLAADPIVLGNQNVVRKIIGDHLVDDSATDHTSDFSAREFQPN